jgi:hypothetical protein
VVAAEDAVMPQKAEVQVTKKGSKSILQRIQSAFSKVPMRDIEE